MASTRATKSGINREVQAKLNAKYDAPLAAQCMKWIKEQIGEPSLSTVGDAKVVHEQLKSGQRLALLANKLKPGSISQKKIDGARMAFKQMELINSFVEVCRGFGVTDHEVFATVDLYEEQNMTQVIICLSALMRKFGLGPKEATETRREFSEEALRAGQTVIGLQMGTNRGASQAGMNMGNTRHIVD